ncbi:MAG: fasciclin domain-containing protein [Fimbriimonadales bacterium]
MATIVDIAVQAGKFNTLVQAVQAAGLVETLSGEGPFTVFAPTDEAFAQIPQDTLQAVLADKEKLTAILTYHVVPGKLTAVEVARSTQLQTVQGQSITVSTEGGVRVDDANVIQTDIEADNGIIHVIDRVIMPK